MEQEATIVLDAQQAEGEMFRQEALEEIKDIQARIVELREKFTENHDPSPDKSFLKQKLD